MKAQRNRDHTEVRLASSRGTVGQDIDIGVPHAERPRSSTAAIVVATILTIGAMRLGRDIALPVALSVLLTLLLSAPVRWLRRRGITERFGAALVVFGTLAILVGATAALATPAVQWLVSAPAALQGVEAKLRRLSRPLAALQQSADRIENVTAAAGAVAPPKVEIVSPGILSRASTQTLRLVPAGLTVVFLTYFLLAAAPLFRRKLIQILPGRRDVAHFEKILAEIELATSRFLATTTLINLCVGVATALSLWAVGLPNPVLWGVVAAVLNFVPYLGPVVTASVIAVASLATTADPGRALLAPGVFILIHLTENNLVTPTILGRRLPLNTVAIFLGLISFAWVWGIAGAVMAVPLTVVMKIACDHVPGLEHAGELLGN